MEDEALQGISAYANAYTRKLMRLLENQARHRRKQDVFLAGVWIPKKELAYAASELRSRERALVLLVCFGSALLTLAMLVFWFGFSWMFLP